jgi:hypothetical protein
LGSLPNVKRAFCAQALPGRSSGRRVPASERETVSDRRYTLGWALSGGGAMNASSEQVGATPRESASAGTPRAARRRAAGIYGTVITAAVLASAGGRLPTLALAVAVLVTLIVYWVAELYSEILGEQALHAHLPLWPRIRDGLASTWTMVSAAYLPVLALVVSRLFGASPTAAANIALAVAVVVLVIHGWSAGRAAELRGAQLVIVVTNLH